MTLTFMTIDAALPLVRSSEFVRRFPRRPGDGWKAYGQTPVWEHSNGVRVHIAGLCRLQDGTIVNGNLPPEEAALKRAIREQGDTRRRGLMVWALAIAPNTETTDSRENL